MKAWFSKYFNLVFAVYLCASSMFFAYVGNWNACAGYACAAMAWGLLWFIERLHNKTIAEIDHIYHESLDELRKHYIRDINLERAKNAA